MAFENCIKEIRKAAGAELDEAEIERLLTLIAQRAQRKRAAGRSDASDADLLTEAAEELTAEAKAAAAIEERNALRNLVKRVGRREFYEAAPAAGKTPGILIGLEAKLVGVNTPFAGSRLSVDAQRNELRRDYLVGLTTDLDRAGLFETARSGALERAWARELYELSKTDGTGKPGVTGDKHALQIAQAVNKYQRLSVDDLNRAGAWVGEYQGYITRTSHDSDKLRRATYDTWKQAIADKLDPRTFDGVEDPDKFLHGVYDGLVTGVHLTAEGMQGFKDPAFKGPGNLAKRLSQGRVLHFKDADAWFDYHRQFGTGTLIESVLRSLDHSARHTALMREFGTNPRAEFDADLQFIREKHRGDHDLIRKLGNAETMLDAQFKELDGTALRPTNSLAARINGGVRSVIRMAKLGFVLVSSLNDTVTKAAELKYQGINLLQGYGDGMASLARGRGKGEVRDIYDLLRAGMDGMVGDIASRFDGADTVPGTLAKVENTYFRWTGLTGWTDRQRGGAEFVMARHLGKLADRNWKNLPEETRRLLTMFDIGEADWSRLRSVDLAMANGRKFLTPDAAARIKNAGSDYTRDLAMKIHAMYADRGSFAVIQPGAREHAILRRGTRPGDALGEAIRYIGMLKAFPVAMITKAWGREINGGNSGYAAVAGITHLLVASTVMGYLAMTAKDLLKGRNPRDPTSVKTWLAAFTQGGGAGIYGDFITGEYSRMGRSFVASLAGPVIGQLDTVLDIWNRAKARATGDGHADLAATTFRAVLDNVPFANLAYARMGLDYLYLLQIQEALNPGFLRRFEQKVQKENHQTFYLRPSQTIPYGGGAHPLVPGSNLVRSGGTASSSAAPTLR